MPSFTRRTDAGCKDEWLWTSPPLHTDLHSHFIFNSLSLSSTTTQLNHNQFCFRWYDSVYSIFPHNIPFSSNSYLIFSLVCTKGRANKPSYKVELKWFAYLLPFFSFFFSFFSPLLSSPFTLLSIPLFQTLIKPANLNHNHFIFHSDFILLLQWRMVLNISWLKIHWSWQRRWDFLLHLCLS